MAQRQSVGTKSIPIVHPIITFVPRAVLDHMALRREYVRLCWHDEYLRKVEEGFVKLLHNSVVNAVSMGKWSACMNLDATVHNIIQH